MQFNFHFPMLKQELFSPSTRVYFSYYIGAGIAQALVLLRSFLYIIVCLFVFFRLTFVLSVFFHLTIVLSVFFHLTIVLSVILRFAASNYPFGVLNLFLNICYLIIRIF